MKIQSSSVLIVDDDPLVRESFRDHFTDLGATVSIAVNGQDAIRLLTDGYTYDLVVTDILMPNRDGIELIRTLRTINPTIKVIAISGGGTGDALDYLTSAKKFGAVGFLQKPVRIRDLDQFIESL